MGSKGKVTFEVDLISLQDHATQSTHFSTSAFAATTNHKQIPDFHGNNGFVDIDGVYYMANGYCIHRNMNSPCFVSSRLG